MRSKRKEERVNEKQEERVDEKQDEVVSRKEKKSFWKRLFGKNY